MVRSTLLEVLSEDYISMGPIQKFGIETPSRETPMAIRSGQRPFFNAETIPIGTATIIDTSSEVTASSAVAGRRSSNRSSTGLRECKEVPR